MTNEYKQLTDLHSAEYFGDSRDFWWNADFLQLMATRWRLETVSTVLDVGCGVGHWGRTLAPFLPKLSSLTGIDREPKWVEEAGKKIEGSPLAGKASYRIGDALALPFADNQFDMVTCQTVLIHLKDPQRALREFARVLKPGGLLAVAEPNNVANSLVSSNLDKAGVLEDFLAMSRFQARCERGKALLGEGDNSIGDLVPGFMCEQGLENIQVHISDKASPLLPPYASPEQRALVDEIGDRQNREIWLWSRSETWRYFEAAGGTPSEFEEMWNSAGARHRANYAACLEQRFYSNGAGMVYLIAGRKPV